MGPLNEAWLFLKSPVYAEEQGESPPEGGDEQFTMLPNLREFGGFMWQSEDGMARGTLYPDFWHNALLLSNFEMGKPVRAKRKSRDYVKDMIREGHEKFNNKLDGTHGIRVESHTAAYWNKLVDEGILDGAHQNSLRVSTDGSQHFTHAYDDERKKPWKHEPSEDYTDYHDLKVE